MWQQIMILLKRRSMRNLDLLKPCGAAAGECEDKVKEDVQATARCIPFEQENLSDKCVVCGKPAKKNGFTGGVLINYED